MNLSSTKADTKAEPRFFIVRGILLIVVLLLVLVGLTLWGEAHDWDRSLSAQFFSDKNSWFRQIFLPGIGSMIMGSFLEY